MSGTDPERRLEAFLAKGPIWQQKVLQLDYEDLWHLSGNAKAAWKKSGYQLRVDVRTENQYLDIIGQIPGGLKGYHKALGKLSPLLVPEGKRGRPRMDKEAEELAKLHSVKSYRQIAREQLQDDALDPESRKLLVEKEAERIRKLLNSRRRRNA